jgi:hypothetical protein
MMRLSRLKEEVWSWNGRICALKFSAPHALMLVTAEAMRLNAGNRGTVMVVFSPPSPTVAGRVPIQFKRPALFCRRFPLFCRRLSFCRQPTNILVGASVST